MEGSRMPRAKTSASSRTRPRSRGKAAAPGPFGGWWPLLVAVAIFLVLGLAAVWRYSLRLSEGVTTADGTELAISYTTEQGDGATSGVINSPVVISLRIPPSYEPAGTVLSAIEVSFFDATGQP